MSLDEKAYHNPQLLPVRYSVPFNFHVCYVFHERVYSNRFLSVTEGGMYPLQSQVLKSGAGMLGWAFSKSFKNFLRSFKGLSVHWNDNDTHIHIHTHALTQNTNTHALTHKTYVQDIHTRHTHTHTHTH